jgi:hypothetical protein
MIICKKILIYLKSNKAKQTFANLPYILGVQAKVYFAYIQVGSNFEVEKRNQEYSETN